MRELVSVLSGNELVFGIVLGSWMLLTGIGAALGRTAGRLRAPMAALIPAQILIALLPIASVLLLRWLSSAVFLRGAEVGVTGSVACCLALLAPYCLVMGYVLPTVCRGMADRGLGTLADGGLGTSVPRAVGRVYLLDNLGNVLGGLAFVLVLANLSDRFVMLYFAAALNLLSAAALAASTGRRLLAAAAATLLAALLATAACWDLDGFSCRLEYAGQNVLFHGTSPYGSLVVTQSAGQLNFIQSGVPLFSTNDAGQIEEPVHYAMAQRPDARRVLLIGGGASGMAREVLKYPVDGVDYVELDPLVLAVARRYVPESLADPRIHTINTDGRRFVRQAGRRYDVVILGVPEPSTSQINRFYTREFFAEVHRILAPDGVLSLSVGTYEDYLSPELARLTGVTERTLRQVFARVLILPGQRVCFLASDGDLTTDVAGRIERAGVRNRLVGRNYLKGTFTPDRMADVRRAVAAGGPVNEDFNPILYYYHLRYWMRQFQAGFGLFEGLLLLLLAVYMVRLRPVALAVFCGGLAASALEVVLLLAFQIVFGSLYYGVGVIVTTFMAGLVLGAAIAGGKRQDAASTSARARRMLMVLAAAVALYAACLPAALAGLGKLEGPAALAAAAAAIPLLVLVLAVLVGMEFPLAARLDDRDAATTSARFYTADYVGAALGALLVSTWLIPVLGVTIVCLLTAGLNLLAAGAMRLAPRNY